MKIALAADHAGFHLKEHLRDWLTSGGHEVVDFGTSSEISTDYPDYARTAGLSIRSGDCDLGVLVCYTGVGMSISANKIPGIRAALAANEETVELTRRSARFDATRSAAGRMSCSSASAGAKAS